MAPHTDDLRIRKLDELVTPAAVIGELPCDDAVSQTVSDTRAALHDANSIASVPHTGRDTSRGSKYGPKRPPAGLSSGLAARDPRVRGASVVNHCCVPSSP